MNTKQPEIGLTIRDFTFTEMKLNIRLAVLICHPSPLIRSPKLKKLHIHYLKKVKSL